MVKRITHGLPSRARDADLPQLALSELCLAHANAAVDFARFRREVLKLKAPLANSEVAQWIAEQSAKDRHGAPRPKFGETVEDVAFSDAECEPVVPNRTLDKLRKFSDRLAKGYGWSREAATHFILAETPPHVEGCIVGFRENLTFPRLSRILMTIDPATPPHQVAALYRAERAKKFPRRLKSIGIKSLQMVRFHVDQLPNRLTWEQQMHLWNKRWSTRPSYKFKHPANFGKRVAEAIRSLLLTRGSGLASKRQWRKKK